WISTWGPSTSKKVPEKVGKITCISTVGEFLPPTTAGIALSAPTLGSGILLASARFFKSIVVLPVLAVFVVFFPFLRITQVGMGFVDLLEFLLGFLIPRIDVRVVLPRQFTIRFFDGFGIGVLVDPQYFIVIYEFHYRRPKVRSEERRVGKECRSGV